MAAAQRRNGGSYVSNFNPNDMLGLVDLERRPSDNKDFLVGVGLGVTWQLNVGSAFRVDLFDSLSPASDHQSGLSCWYVHVENVRTSFSRLKNYHFLRSYECNKFNWSLENTLFVFCS